MDPTRPRRSLGSIIVGTILKLLVVVVILASVIGLIFYGGITQDQHGLKALREQKPIVGAWLGEWPGDDNPALQRFEQSTGVELDVVDVFLDFYTPASNVTHTVKHIADYGAVAMLTWEPHGFTTEQILDGKSVLPLRDGRRMPMDNYMDEFADGICDVERETGQPVIIRFMHEMNGNWYSWGVTYEQDGRRPNSDENYRQAWRKVHGIFERHCDQTMWMWAVNHFSVGDGATFTGTYPGDEYVDYVGMDGYNWGDNAEWGWQGFDTLFRDVYCTLKREVPNKKIIIAETATTEEGGQKAAWIEDLFARVAYKQYPNVVGIIYFNYAKFEVEIDGNMDWPIDSSPEATQAFSRGASLVLQARENDLQAPPADTTSLEPPGPRC